MLISAEISLKIFPKIQKITIYGPIFDMYMQKSDPLHPKPQTIRKNVLNQKYPQL